MWLHPAENIRFGARHHQVNPQIRCLHHSPSLPHKTKTWLCATLRQTPVFVPMTSGCQRAVNKYRHASHEARYVVIYACSKSNEFSLRYSHFLGSSTERIALYKQIETALKPEKYKVSWGVRSLFCKLFYILLISGLK